MVKGNCLASLQRELTVFMLEGNDYMVDKIQLAIDQTIRAQTLENLNEVVQEETEDNICD